MRVYNGTANISIYNTILDEWIFIKSLSVVDLAERTESYIDSQGEYVNTGYIIDLKIKLLETNQELINKIKSYGNDLCNIFIQGFGHFIEIDGLPIVIQINRDYPKTHTADILASKHSQLSLSTIPQTDWLKGIGGFENNNGAVGDGWGVIMPLATSIVPAFNPEGGASAQEISYDTSSPPGHLSTTTDINLPIRYGNIIALSGLINKVSPAENIDLNFELVLHNSDDTINETLNNIVTVTDDGLSGGQFFTSKVFVGSLFAESIVMRTEINIKLHKGASSVVQIDNLKMEVF